MISPELLRRYPSFGLFNETQLKAIAMIAEEDSAPAGTVLFEERQPATHLYLLLEGGVDLSYRSEEEYHPKTRKEFAVGEINPGELFSISALIEPYVLNATARLSQDSKFVKIEAASLRELMEQDCSMGYLAMKQITKALMERLIYTRVQLAACWSSS
jgi:CRP-like cAMP-binding protein